MSRFIQPNIGIPTFKEFNARISYGDQKGVDDSAWRAEVGYRPDDKDGGFTRWLEITGKEENEATLRDFREVVCGDNWIE